MSGNDTPLDGARTVRAGEELDRERLGTFLRQHFPGTDGELAVEQFPFGHSNLTYLLRLGGREMVLRRPPFGSKVTSAHDMGREYRVLSQLHKVYSPAPKTFLYCDDDSVLGAPFYLMERVRGVILRKELPPGLSLPPETVQRLSESFIDSLADLHSLDYAAAGLGDLGKPEGYTGRQVEGWIKRYGGSKTHEIAEVEPVSAWLREQLPPANDAALIHNDFKYDNLVLDPGDLTRIAGVLDWEMCTLGDPLMDLGSALSYWTDPDDPEEEQQLRWGPTTLPGSLTRQQLVERYAEHTGHDVSHAVFYYVFGLFKTAVIAQQIYYRFHHGTTKDKRFAFFIEATKILLRTARRAARSGKI